MASLGLLESVRKYHPRDGSDPLENFITEAFAWMLRNCPEFGEYFASNIAKQLNMSEFDTANQRWETQQNFGGVYPDMVCSSGAMALVFEHKTWSEVGDNQISNYRSYANKNYSESRIVLISANKYQHIHQSEHENKPDLQLCWSNVYEDVEEWMNKSGNTPFIAEDFNKLLDSVNLGRQAPLSQDSIRYYFASTNLKKNIGTLIRNVKDNGWLDGWSKCHCLDVIDKRGSEYSEAHGRMGLEFHVSDNIRLFVGIVINENDLGARALNRHKGPDMIVAPIFGEMFHSQYLSAPEFRELNGALKEIMIGDDDGWHFYDNISDANSLRKNKWVPFQIRKSLFDVLSGTTDSESQATEFFNSGKKVIDILLNEKSFSRLREDLDSNARDAA